MKGLLPMKISPIIQPTSFGSKKLPLKPSGSNQRLVGNCLMGTLIALAALSPIKSNAAEGMHSSVQSEYVVNSDDDFDISTESITVDFKDENGILETTDFTYSSPEARKLAQPYLKGLKPYMGKKSNQAVSDLAQNLTHLFNRSNNYAYDLNTDELVKDAEATIKYDKLGRVSSTVLKSSYGEESVVNYKYFANGNIDRATYVGDKVIEYRQDGTRYSLETIDESRPKLQVYYTRSGQKAFQKETSPFEQTEITYDAQGGVIKYFHKDNQSGYQKIYNNGDPVLITNYDGKGRFRTYIDKYFEKTGEDLYVHGYMGKVTKIHNDQHYNVLYKEAPLTGKIDRPVRQGTTGTCYIAGIVNSLVMTPAGRLVLDNALPNDYDHSTCIVNLKGLNKSYSIPADVISANMSRLGRRSADYAGMVRAFERFRETELTPEEELNLPNDFFKNKRGDNDRRVDSGFPTEFYFALTGSEMAQSGDKITDLDIAKAKKCLETGRGVVNAGTVSRDNKNNEIPEADVAKGITHGHNMAVRSINAQYVTLYDSVTEKDIVYPIDKFKKYFSKLYYATLP